MGSEPRPPPSSGHSCPTFGSALIELFGSSSAGSGGDGPAGDPPTDLAERVANDHYKKEHLVVHGPPSLEIGMWVTQCGWRFGRSSVARRPEAGDQLCSRCFKHKLG